MKTINLKLKPVLKLIILHLVLHLIVLQQASAQSFYSRRVNRNLMFSYGIGATTYHGDLNDIFFDRLGAATKTNFGIGLRKKVGSQLSLRLDFNRYTISGSDAASGTLKGKEADRRNGQRTGQNDTRFIRNLSFSANNYELSLQGIFNLIPDKRSYRSRTFLNPYIILGFGISTNNPTGEHPTEGKANLRKLNTEALAGGGYSGLLFVVPAGLGIRVKANQYIDILLEAGRRFTFSDYLDDVSTVYASRDELLAASRSGSNDQALIFFDRSAEGGFPARRPGNTRGNPDKNDAYYIFQIRLEMYLPHNFLSNALRGRRKPKFR